MSETTLEALTATHVTPPGRVMVTIVLITRNRAGLLPGCLRSLFAQSHWPLEIVVVDDGSTDDTQATLAKLAEQCPPDIAFVVCTHRRNRGIGAARNTGIDAAHGTFIAFTDDDCIAAPDWIANLIEPFAEDASLAIVGGGIDEPADRTWAQRASEGINFLGHRRRAVRSIVGCNMAFDGAFVREHRFDDEARSYADELDRCLTAHAHGRGVLFTPAARVTHHHRQQIGAFLRQQRRRGAGAVWVRHKHGLGLWPHKYWVMLLLVLSPIMFAVLPLREAVVAVLAAALLFVLQTVVLDRARGKRWRDLLVTLPLVLPGYLCEFFGAIAAIVDGRRQ